MWWWKKRGTVADPDQPLEHGWIARFRSPEVDFHEALEAGVDRALEYFCEVLGGLTVGHADELRRLGFFRAVEERVGVPVEVKCWQEIKAADLPPVITIVEELIPRASDRLRPLLRDLGDMARGAVAEGCSIGFRL